MFKCNTLSYGCALGASIAFLLSIQNVRSEQLDYRIVIDGDTGSE